MSAAWFVLAVLASRSAASVLGVLESTAPDLVGWACESTMANRTLDVELYIGSRDTGVRIARLRAAQPRPEISVTCKCRGLCAKGFKLAWTSTTFAERFLDMSVSVEAWGMLDDTATMLGPPLTVLVTHSLLGLAPPTEPPASFFTPASSNMTDPAPSFFEANQAFVFAGCAGVVLILCIIGIVIALRCRKRKKNLVDDSSVPAHAMTPVVNSAFPAAFNATPAAAMSTTTTTTTHAHSGGGGGGTPSYAAHSRTARASPAHPPGYVQNKVQGDMDQLAQWQAEALAKREMPPIPGQKAKIEYDSDDESHPKNRARIMPGYQLQTYDQAPPEFD